MSPPRRCETLTGSCHQFGAELVLNGHNHHVRTVRAAERRRPPDPAGPRQFVVGTGGYPLYSRERASANSEVLEQRHLGVLKLTLKAGVLRVGVRSRRGQELPRQRHRDVLTAAAGLTRSPVRPPAATRTPHVDRHTRVQHPRRPTRRALRARIGARRPERQQGGHGGRTPLDVRASALPDQVKTRLAAALAGRRMSADGVILIDSREHRTQAGNRRGGTGAPGGDWSPRRSGARACGSPPRHQRPLASGASRPRTSAPASRQGAAASIHPTHDRGAPCGWTRGPGGGQRNEMGMIRAAGRGRLDSVRPREHHLLDGRGIGLLFPVRARGGGSPAGRFGLRVITARVDGHHLPRVAAARGDDDRAPRACRSS